MRAWLFAQSSLWVIIHQTAFSPFPWDKLDPGGQVSGTGTEGSFVASFIVELQLMIILGLTGAPSKPRHGLRAASLPVYPELSAST